ncbi:hypothetical protein E4N71_03035 [Treponema vincentii]|uniref:hypothetical protein n=1 Tax=Treponema vincentii TaxID=69710 RepID=UPI003D8E1927
MKKMKRAVSFVLIVLAAITGFTCRPNIGLGGQIDIVPPEGEITYPDAGETPIRGSFVLQGKASDDDGIQSITVVFENIETKARSSVYTAEGFTAGSASASWTVTVENEATETEPGHELVKIYPIPDGEYTAILTVTDKGGKSTAVTKNYKIDNTPPVFLVSRPSTIADATGTVTQQADKYGAVFSVVGQAGERNTVEKLTVSVPGAEQATMTSKFVGTNINAKVAVYTETPPTNPLYDLQEQDKTQPIRGQLYLYDNAREYKGGDPSGEGNKAEWFYLWDKIYDDVIAKGYTPEVISDYFSGKKGSDANDHEKKIKALRSDTTALNTLKTERVNMDKQRSIFRLDPKKSPGFKVIGIRNLAERPLNVSKASSMLFKSGDETSFIVELIRNKDNTPLVKDNTLEAYKNSNIEIVLLKWDGTGTENESFVTGEHLEEIPLLKFADLKEEDASRITVEGGNLRVKCTFTTLTEGAYAVNVKGTDTSGEASSNSFAAYDDSNSANGGLYIVNFLAVGNGPRIRPVRPQGFKNTTVDIEADVSGIENGGTVYYVIKKKQKGNTGIPSDGPYPPTTLQKVSASEDTAVPRYKAVIDIPASATFDQQPLTDGDYEVYFLVKADSGATDRDSTDFTVDRTAPTVELTYPDYSDPQAGEITVSGSITDVGAGVKAESTKYILGKKTPAPNETTAGWKNMDSSTRGSWNARVNLDNVPEGERGMAVGAYKEIPLYIFTEDEIGNKAVRETKILFDPEGTKPVVKVLSPQQTDPATTLGGTIQIFGTASVPKGGPGAVGKVYIQFSHDGNFANAADGTFGTKDWYNNGDGQLVPGTDTGGGADWRLSINDDRSFNHATAQNQSVYFRVRAENKTNNQKGEWTTPVEIIVDKDAPTIGSPNAVKIDNVSSTDPEGSDNAQDYTPNMWIGRNKKLIGSLHDESGIKAVQITSTGLAGGITYNLTAAKNAGWITAAGNNYELQIPLNLDTLSPAANAAGEFSITISITENKDTNPLSSERTFMFRFDKTKPAVIFGTPVGKIGTGNFTAESATNIIAATANTPLENLYVFVETKEGSAREIKVKEVGNGYITYDNDNGATLGEQSMYVLVRKNPIIYDSAASDWQLQGFAYDKGAGVKEVKATIAGADFTVTAFTGELGNFSSFKESLKTSVIDDGQQTLTLTVSDKAGNSGTQTSDTVYLRNKPLKISKVHFKTDLDYGGTYENVSKRGLVEIVTESGSDSHVNNEKNYVQDLDIHTRFAFKNGTKSQIAFELAGGKGTARTYEIYAVGSDGKPLSGAYIKRGGLTDNAGQKVIDLSPADFTGATSVFSEGAEKKFAIVLRDEAAQMNTGTGNVTGDAERKLTFTVTIGVKTVDNRKPQILILPFYWNGEDDNSLAEHKQSNGHIEIARVSVDNSGNPSLGVSDVSGKVVVRGTAYHPARLTKLQLTVPNTASSTSEVPVTAYYHSRGWTDSTAEPPITPDPPVPSALKVTDERIDVNGHWVAWEYVWDTGTPAVNKEIKAAAWHNTFESAAATAGSLESKTAQERADKQSLKLHGDHSGKAVAGQFLRLFKDERSYLVTINRVNDDGSVEWRLIDVPTDITDYYLYPVYTTDTAGYNKPNVKVNIVPYITGIETPLSIDGGTEPDLYARTALGRYPVKDGATITVKGFNLTGAKCKVKSKKADGSGDEYSSEVVVTGTASPWTWKLPADAKSGTLTAKVNGIEAVNNKNSNKKDYHKGTKTANNKNLTDDVELDVWQFNTEAALPGRGYVAEPVMHINPQNGIIGFAFANGPDTFSMTKGQDSSYEGWHKNYDDFANVDFIYDSTGVSHGVVVGRDINSGQNHAGKFTYLTSKWGPASSLNDGNNYNGSNALRLEAIGQQGSMTGGSNYILDKGRIQHPSLAAAEVSGGKTRLYLAYYDSINDQIRFKAGELPSGGKQSFGQFVDQETGRPVTAYNQSNVSIIAGKYKSNKDTNNKPGTYLSLGVVSGANADADVAVLVWFDATNKKLKYTYKKKPQTAHHAGAVSVPADEAWAAPKDVFGTKNIGAYCKLVVDKNGGIHIAAYSTDTKDLHYAYLPSYNASSFTTSVVDSYGITGSQIRLDVALSANGNPIPYIGYYSPSAGYAKLAYLVDKSFGFDQGAAGVEGGYFTGDWEITCIPTESELVEDNINVGVWKDADGKIKASVTGSGGSNTTSGTVYGNGTANPVLGYATTQSINGFIETAQKK